MSKVSLSGGCQCGAIRFHVQGKPELAAICHCRMCQKATGSIGWAFVTFRCEDLTWTRGAPKHFRSSGAATRGYCPDCGTPLTFEPDGEETIDLSIGAFDAPETLEPTAQVWIDARLPWFHKLAELPVIGLGSALPHEEVTRRTPYQHPDHDTQTWPPKG